MVQKDVLKSKYGPLALTIWAIDRDCLSLPFHKAWEAFCHNAWDMYKTYTDPNDSLLYCKNLKGVDYLDFFVDYIMFYALAHINSGIYSYGKLDTMILKYSA